MSARNGNGEPPAEGAPGSKLFDDLTGIGIDWRAALLVPLLAILTALLNLQLSNIPDITCQWSLRRTFSESHPV